MKTVLAPGAPWYDPVDLIWPVNKQTVIKQPYVPKKIEKRTHRAKPSEIDAKFEEWLLTLEKIK